MKVKAFEIRDKGTFIPAFGVLMCADGIDHTDDSEGYLLRRAGFSDIPPFCVVLCRMECKGVNRNATYDPYSWADRTWQTAHLYIEHHWNELESGAVICVETILGERKEPKPSERLT